MTRRRRSKVSRLRPQDLDALSLPHPICAGADEVRFRPKADLHERLLEKKRPLSTLAILIDKQCHVDLCRREIEHYTIPIVVLLIGRVQLKRGAPLACSVLDQRGYQRAGLRCDAGAAESSGTPPPPRVFGDGFEL